MRMSIVAVGRLKSGPERDLFERYLSRLEGLGRSVGIGSAKLVEITESRAGSAAVRKSEEAGSIIGKCADTALLVALDERGKALTSRSLASTIGEWRDSGVHEICFAIGGADGHGDAVRSAARLTLSLGKLTLPHGLARIVLIEQLYRSATILAGHPYHRE